MPDSRPRIPAAPCLESRATMMELAIGQERDCGYVRLGGRPVELVTVRRRPDGYAVIRRPLAHGGPHGGGADIIAAVHPSLGEAVSHGLGIVVEAADPYPLEPEPAL